MRIGLVWLPVALFGMAGCAAMTERGAVGASVDSNVGVWSDTPAAFLQEESASQVPAGQTPVPSSEEAPVEAAVVPSETVAAVGHAGGPSIVSTDSQCWVQSIVRPKPVQQAVDVVVRDSVNKLRVTPALLTDERKQVVTKDGTVSYEVQPPIYKAVIDKVEIRPAIERTVVVPAVFEEVTETVEIEAARTELEACSAAGVRFSGVSMARTLCARQIPAKTEVVKKNRLVTPETTKVIVEPAQYKEVTRWVLEVPARAVPVSVPEETAQLAVKAIAQPERVEESQVPALSKQLAQISYVGQPELVTVPAVCDRELSERMILALQDALLAAGFDPGRLDGKLGPRTVAALLDYQWRNGLAYGALTYESLERLGVR